jgi:hypothetical protein
MRFTAAYSMAPDSWDYGETKKYQMASPRHNPPDKRGDLPICGEDTELGGQSAGYDRILRAKAAKGVAGHDTLEPQRDETVQSFRLRDNNNQGGYFQSSFCAAAHPEILLLPFSFAQ